MDKIIVLGTGTASATKCYNTCFAMQSGEEYFLVDGGGGNAILTQLEHAKINIFKIRKIFVSHSHTDHILGIVWIIRKICIMVRDGVEFKEKFNIFASRKTINSLKMLLNILFTYKDIRYVKDYILFTKVRSGNKIEWRGNDIMFFDILSKKNQQFGFQVKLIDGALTFAGDEQLHEKLFDLARDSKWLLHEVYCMNKDIEKARTANHCTTEIASKIAANLNVKNLVVWHTTDDDLINRQRKYIAEISENFGGKIFVPNDLDVLDLKEIV